ncbi:uncharacterized protein SPSC_00524 [Sporisorium scitamineum]|uniref:AB hydrolase-1 domain-containing protein n=1 Tax=Sporisorium scitamineum TaxID=49012 RepID=A0A0F7S147_9BASI|nr:uncharacterized protein SPSC_00524 [Sporisorium scitamineum]CDW93931.1 hypothetical protein [Sporisorium scitamineum]
MSQLNPFDSAGLASGTITVPAPPHDPDVRVSIFYRHFISASPTAVPIVLLHGHPQTHVIWSSIAPVLASMGKYHVVVPDNRGNGGSSAPEAKNDGERYSRYNKREMARDMAVLMSSLGYETFHIVAHDRGARVAHRLALDWPAKMRKLILLDIAPTLDMYETTDWRFATVYWHWFFLLQPNAESFITSNPQAYLNAPITRFPTPDDQWRMSCYLTNCSNPTNIAAMCEDYRASAPSNAPDLTLDRADRQAGRKILCPTSVL